MEAFGLRGWEILGQQREVLTQLQARALLYSSNVDQVFFIRKISPLIRGGIFEQHLVVARSDMRGLQTQAGV